MGFFAKLGIFEAFAKLAVVLALSFAPIDKLKVYAGLLFAVGVVVCAANVVYCRRAFAETKFRFFWDKGMFWERMGFSGWTTLGGVSAVAAIQGVNMGVNVFFGVIGNAAMGIMTQVQNALNQFLNNFLSAVNPQITKLCAQQDMEHMHLLLFRSTKFSFILFFALSMPLILNMDFVLQVWLKTVPPNAVFLCQGILLCQMFGTLNVPTNMSILAMGNIRKIYISAFIASMLNFLVILFLFWMGFSQKVIPFVYFSTQAVTIVYSFILAKEYHQFAVVKFLKEVCLRLLVVVLISLPLSLWLANQYDGVLGFLLSSSVFVAIFLPSAYWLGLASDERNFILYTLQKLKQRFTGPKD
jgi:O-antigen/teichoic acid export membrane protein